MHACHGNISRTWELMHLHANNGGRSGRSAPSTYQSGSGIPLECKNTIITHLSESSCPEILHDRRPTDRPCNALALPCDSWHATHSTYYSSTGAGPRATRSTNDPTTATGVHTHTLPHADATRTPGTTFQQAPEAPQALAPLMKKQGKGVLCRYVLIVGHPNYIK